jgi:hypothetical protein
LRLSTIYQASSEEAFTTHTNPLQMKHSTKLLTKKVQHNNGKLC